MGQDWHDSKAELDHRGQHREARDGADDDAAGPQPAFPHGPAPRSTSYSLDLVDNTRSDQACGSRSRIRSAIERITWSANVGVSCTRNRNALSSMTARTL